MPDYAAMFRPTCRVYWGSHGCQWARGHAGPHECDCCDCPPDHDHAQPIQDDDEATVRCVAKPPYYGAGTKFYGEDAAE